MAQTGMQRSLTLKINKTIAGVQVEGYPITYQGRNAFSYNGHNYALIDMLKMRTMPVNDYTARLNDFKSYVTEIEQGIDLENDTIEGKDAYQMNVNACPIG